MCMNLNMMWWKKDLWRNRLFTNAEDTNTFIASSIAEQRTRVSLIMDEEKEDEDISLHINTDVSSHLE